MFGFFIGTSRVPLGGFVELQVGANLVLGSSRLFMHLNCVRASKGFSDSLFIVLTVKLIVCLRLILVSSSGTLPCFSSPQCIHFHVRFQSKYVTAIPNQEVDTDSRRLLSSRLAAIFLL